MDGLTVDDVVDLISCLKVLEEFEIDMDRRSRLVELENKLVDIKWGLECRQ